MVKNKKGFTLVELMVVVAILGVLVAIAVPAYNGITTTANKKVCAANLKLIEQAAVQASLMGRELPSGTNRITFKFMLSPEGELTLYEGSSGSEYFYGLFKDLSMCKNNGQYYYMARGKYAGKAFCTACYPQK